MTELQIRLNDGTKFYVEVENYDAEEMAERINDETKNMIVIGSAVVQRYSIVRVIPRDEIEEQ